MSQVDEKHLNTHRSLKLKVKVRFLTYHRIETPQIRLCFIICYFPIGTHIGTLLTHCFGGFHISYLVSNIRQANCPGCTLPVTLRQLGSSPYDPELDKWKKTNGWMLKCAEFTCVDITDLRYSNC